LGRERRRNEKLECERQILVASIAHSVKTPVMNIRLYAEALNNGLTLEDGTKADIKDIAAKIDSNADRIQKIATDVINASVESVTSYEPEISEFYLRELSALINEEYAQQMELSRIPFTVECPDNPLVRSDSYGLLRIISLLLDNAVKYGDGTGITVSLSKEEEGILISVRNKGELLPEEELSFIFTSFRRGSNAVNKEGSGIGLYTAKKIATSLGGNIFARRLPESSEMEFSVYIE
ncbi:MAG: HAMP domain-containing histidine kinase, partial [Clostridiales bacterium]|nr:HAMP domain-containing histidine kinase [Clostridiales bacterium]